MPPIKPQNLPRPYGWEKFHRQNDPNNPYNLVEDIGSPPTPPPSAQTAPPAPVAQPVAPPQPQPQPQQQASVAPSAAPSANEGRVFSGATPLAPRCAKIRGAGGAKYWVLILGVLVSHFGL